jgi:hypothetical protein
VANPWHDAAVLAFSLSSILPLITVISPVFTADSPAMNVTASGITQVGNLIAGRP